MMAINYKRNYFDGEAEEGGKQKRMRQPLRPLSQKRKMGLVNYHEEEVGKQKRMRQPLRPLSQKRKMGLVDDIGVIERDLDEITLDPFPKEKRVRRKLVEVPLLMGRLSSKCRELSDEEKQRILFTRQRRLEFYGLV